VETGLKRKRYGQNKVQGLFCKKPGLKPKTTEESRNLGAKRWLRKANCENKEA
jgi:hypothetical protein